MNINSLKDLEALIKLCRKTGVEAFETSEIKFNLGPQPKAKPRVIPLEDPLAAAKVPQFKPIADERNTNVLADNIKTDALTEEQLLFYSADREQGQ